VQHRLVGIVGISNDTFAMSVEAAPLPDRGTKERPRPSAFVR
jgi:hypothetical protein